MKCDILENAWSSPYELLKSHDVYDISTRSSMSSAYSMLGAIYNSEGVLCSYSERNGGAMGDAVGDILPDKVQPYEKAGYLRGRTVFLGHFMSHYGHFLTEGLSRSWICNFSEFDHYAFFPFIFGAVRNSIKDYHKNILAALGVDIEKIVILRKPVFFEEIWVPEALWKINGRPRKEMRLVYNRIISEVEWSSSPGRYFLSRSKGLNKRIEDAQAIENIFRKENFDVLYPEELSMKDQLSVYQSANIVFSLSGSAMHNVLLARQGADWIEIGDSRQPNSFHPMQAAANDISMASVSRIPFSGAATEEEMKTLERAILARIKSIEAIRA